MLLQAASAGFMESELGGNVISLLGFLVGILTYYLTNRKAQKEQEQKDQRSSVKLKILNYCRNDSRELKDIITHLSHPDTDKHISELETRKATYEMLAEQTLRLRSNGTFKARRNTAKTDEGGESLKLKILFFCEKESRTTDTVYSEFVVAKGTEADDTEAVEKATVSKAIYEMLADETLRLRTDGTLKARRNQPRPGNEDNTKEE